MKKFLVAIATGVIFAGVAVTNVSAEEYEVQKGDSLWKIAEEYNTTVDELVDINELKTKVIQPNQKLLINEIYIVVKGDTLSDIGKEFHVSVKDLKKWNNLKTDLIVIGQELEIKGVNVPKSPKAEQATNTNTAQSNSDKQKVAAKTTEKSQSTDKAPEGKTISVTATAYTAKCAGCSGVTYTGIDLNSNPNAKVIAVDPNVIPLGTEVYVEGYGYATAADIGGAIKGNKIDIHVPTKDEAYKWGVRTVNVTILGK